MGYIMLTPQNMPVLSEAKALVVSQTEERSIRILNKLDRIIQIIRSKDSGVVMQKRDKND